MAARRWRSAGGDLLVRQWRTATLPDKHPGRRAASAAAERFGLHFQPYLGLRPAGNLGRSRLPGRF
jgi:hypothetical protein